MCSIPSYKTITLSALASASIALVGPAQADPIAEFYKGKTVTMYIGYSAGGGYDQYARLLAAHMGRKIPGNPDMVPRNRPGAGSAIVVNELYGRYPQDGTAIATFSRGIPTGQLFNAAGVAYDVQKLKWIGSLNSEVSTCAAWHTAPVKTVQDLFERGLVVGGTGATADMDLFPTVLNNVIGTKLKLITGYPGGNDVNFAMERGEVEGRCAWSWTSLVGTRPEWLKEGKVRILLQTAVKKHPELPNVPWVMDFAKTEKERQILTLIFAGQLWGRPYAVGPQVPDDRVQALRKAFVETANDPVFVEEMKKRKWDRDVLDGETVQKAVAELFSFPPDVVEAAKHARDFQGKIEITKAVIPIETISGKLVGVSKKGVTVEGGGKKQKASVSAVKTKITLAGKEGKIDALKEGMSCKLTYQASAATEIVCE